MKETLSIESGNSTALSNLVRVLGENGFCHCFLLKAHSKGINICFHI